jgi:Ca2+-binding RTX toxin-like protein
MPAGMKQDPLPSNANGGDADDHLEASAGNSAVNGGSGNDYFFEGPRNDDLDGGTGDDCFSGGGDDSSLERTPGLSKRVTNPAS